MILFKSCYILVTKFQFSTFFDKEFFSLRSMAVLSSRAQERRSRQIRAKRARTSDEAARKIKTACPDSWPFQLPPPSTHFDILLTTCLVSVFPANQK